MQLCNEKANQATGCPHCGRGSAMFLHRMLAVSDHGGWRVLAGVCDRCGREISVPTQLPKSAAPALVPPRKSWP